MRPLYEITDDLRRMLDLADETGGELDAAAAEYLATVEAEEAVKLDGYANLIRTLEMEEAAARAEAEQYQLKAAARADAVKRLKGRLLDHLTATGRTKVQTAKGRTISVQANGGKAPVKWSAVEAADAGGGGADAGGAAGAGRGQQPADAEERPRRGGEVARVRRRRPAGEVGGETTATETMGWRPSCDCGPDLEPDACIVLDPFVGSGTTLMVATEHGRRAVGCDLDERNLKLIRDRMELVQPLLPV